MKDTGMYVIADLSKTRSVQSLLPQRSRWPVMAAGGRGGQSRHMIEPCFIGRGRIWPHIYVSVHGKYVSIFESAWAPIS